MGLTHFPFGNPEAGVELERQQSVCWSVGAPFVDPLGGEFVAVPNSQFAEIA